MLLAESGDIDSWEDITSDEQPPEPSTHTSSDTLSSNSTPPTQPTTSEAPDSMETATQPSSSSPASQSIKKETISDTSSVTDETRMATGISKIDSTSQLAPKDHHSPSATPVPKLKTVAAPQKTESDKENVNIVFIGHVDAGKSTIGGHVMLVCVCVFACLASVNMAFVGYAKYFYSRYVQ